MRQRDSIMDTPVGWPSSWRALMILFITDDQPTPLRLIEDLGHWMDVPGINRMRWGGVSGLTPGPSFLISIGEAATWNAFYMVHW